MACSAKRVSHSSYVRHSTVTLAELIESTMSEAAKLSDSEEQATELATLAVLDLLRRSGQLGVAKELVVSLD